MRLDEMVNVTSGHDIFTFDFDHPASFMTLEYTGSTITISGFAFGGRDSGTGYFADQFLGLYTINFVYNVGVGLAAGDDDLEVVAPSFSNVGSIVGPGGSGVNSVLSDKDQGGFTFRFGDEDNDLGHRGFDGLSGWGWLMVDGRHVANMDWIFTAEVPAPGAAGVLALGALALGRRRR
ncbi:MAG: MYXO-CTERM sorting domain-containing protein [Phycisphaerales bacterium]